MSDYSNSNKRLAKNTLILYLRMFITVGISFYTSRVVLKNLGISDYGVYNVVGGFVSMFYIITTAMSGSISRFLTVELGTNNPQRLNDTFCMSVNIQLLFAAVVIVLGETIGLWFVNAKLDIPADRMVAANVVYQFAILSFLVELVGIPYGALVIAHEKMNLYAFVAILNVVLQCVLAWLLVISPIDKLVFYAIGMFSVAVIGRLIYIFYCRSKFPECRYHWVYEKKLFAEMFSFGGWTLLTGASSMFKSQGVNIMLNMFFGTVVNAAYGVARQLEGTVRAFSKNFLFAIYPQITKTYAEGDLERSRSLTYKGTKYAFLLLFLIGLPVMLEVDTFLDVWLVEVPEYTAMFVQLTIMLSLIEVLLIPMGYINQAAGDIKLFQIVSSAAQFLVLPIGYVFLKLGFNPYSVLYTGIATELLTLPWRVAMNKKHAGVTLGEYTKAVLLKILPVIVIPTAVCLVVQHCLAQSILNSCIVAALALVMIAATTYLFAFSKSEQKFMIQAAMKFLHIKKGKNNDIQ